METRPNHTLYVNNLNDRVKKEELKRSLFYLFNQFGKVLDIVALKTWEMRGQAFIIFKDIGQATTAMRALQGFPVFDKPMRVAYSRKDSFIVSRMKGQNIDAAAKAKIDEKKEKKKRKRAALAARAAAEEAGADSSGVNGGAEVGNGDADAVDTPNPILFLTQLPVETTESMLKMLFEQFPGFKEVRSVPGRTDIAFIEYETDAQAATARDAYQGFKLTTDHPMKIAFAKK